MADFPRGGKGGLAECGAYGAGCLGVMVEVRHPRLVAGFAHGFGGTEQPGGYDVIRSRRGNRREPGERAGDDPIELDPEREVKRLFVGGNGAGRIAPRKRDRATGDEAHAQHELVAG